MKKILVATLVALTIVLALGGCKKSDKPLVTTVPGSGSVNAAPDTQADPHKAGATLVPAGIGHKGKVLDVLQAGEYSYIQVEENGKQLWVATVQAKVAKGDVIEFADVPVFPSFQSKTLNRTFENLMMVDAIRNDTQK